MTALMSAAYRSRLQVVRELLAQGANLFATGTGYSDGQTALMCAVEGYGDDSVEIVRELLARGANVNAAVTFDGMTPLLQAASSRQLEAVPVLLAHGADVNAARTDGTTALMFSVIRRSNEGSIRLLLQHGADKSARDALGETAFDKLFFTSSKNVYC